MQSKNHTSVKRPWGEYHVLEKTPKHWLKKIFINKGEQSSLQSHKHRDEIWIVLQGKIKAQKGNDSFILNEGEVLRIGKEEKHRIYGLTKACILEAAFGQPRERDIIRYEDEYGKRISHRGLLGSIHDFGPLARREAVNIGACKSDEIVFLMDGAEGFHNHIKKNLPSARQIVDYWHVCQHISECAMELYPADAKKCEQWRKKYCHMLRESGPFKLLKSLRISKQRTKPHLKADALSKLINFLARRTDRIDYPVLLDLGYRVDSGPIESSCKNVVQRRMKGCGMRWSRKGASAMLEVRCALYSDIWEDVVKKCA